MFRKGHSESDIKPGPKDEKELAIQSPGLRNHSKHRGVDLAYAKRSSQETSLVKDPGS